MSKFFNQWIFLVTVLTIPIALAVGLNQDFHVFGFRIPGEEFVYKDLFFGIAAGLIFLLGALKASKKWTGLFIVRQKERFQFSTPISSARKKRVLLYNSIELLFFAVFASFFFLTDSTWVVAGVFVILFIETLANTFFGINKEAYRVGMTKKAVLRADREVTLVYFKGLEKITKHQQTLYFEYVNDLVLHMPLDVIPDDQKDSFYKALREQANPDQVFYSGF